MSLPRLFLTFVAVFIFGGVVNTEPQCDHNHSIGDLYTRFQILEEKRVQDVKIIENLKGTIDKLKSDNIGYQNRLDIIEKLCQQDREQIKFLLAEVEEIKNVQNANAEKLARNSSSKQELLKILTVEQKTPVEDVNSLLTGNTTDYRIAELKTTNTEPDTTQDVTGTTFSVSVPTSEKQRANSSERTIRVPETIEPPIAFYAYLENYMLNGHIAEGQTIKYDTVITNNGGHYSPTSGIFTCTVPGTYFFHWSTEVRFGKLYAYTFLFRNGINLGQLLVTSGDTSTTASNSVVLNLNNGDNIWIEVGGHSPTLYIDGHRTSFSGFIIGWNRD